MYDRITTQCAPVAELADAPDLGSGVFDVQVQVLSGAPTKRYPIGVFFCWLYNWEGLEPHGGTKREENSPVDCF